MLSSWNSRTRASPSETEASGNSGCASMPRAPARRAAAPDRRDGRRIRAGRATSRAHRRPPPTSATTAGAGGSRAARISLMRSSSRRGRPCRNRTRSSPGCRTRRSPRGSRPHLPPSFFTLRILTQRRLTSTFAWTATKGKREMSNEEPEVHEPDAPEVHEADEPEVHGADAEIHGAEHRDPRRRTRRSTARIRPKRPSSGTESARRGTSGGRGICFSATRAAGTSSLTRSCAALIQLHRHDRRSRCRCSPAREVALASRRLRCAAR